MRSARERAQPIVGEKHHVLPKTFGGTDDCLVVLSFREHYLAHWLLTKFTKGDDRRRMNYALAMMANDPGHRRIAAWQVERARASFIHATRGRTVSAETKAKMRETALKRSPEYREKQRLAQLGRKRTDATRAKLSAATKAINPIKRAEMDAARRGFKHKPETRARMSASKVGHSVSPETRAKIRLKMIGNKNGAGGHSPEANRKISASLKGHAVSEETRAKLRAVPREVRSAAAKLSWITRRAKIDAECEDVRVRGEALSDVSS